MSVELIAMPHPLRSDRITREVAAKPLREIYADLDPVLPIEHARFMVEDRVVTDVDVVPEDGTTVLLKVVPAGGGDSLRETGENMKVAAALLPVVGLVVGTLLGGPMLGALLFSGSLLPSVALFTGGVVLYNIDIPGVPKSPDRVEADPSIRGSRNRTNLGGVVPLLLGRHLITPDNGALPYTSISGNMQHFHQLFVAGYSDMVVDAASFKIGDTPLSFYSGVDPVEVIQDGSASSVYPEIVKETRVGQEVKNQVDGESGALVRTTTTNTRRISVDISFPRGLVRYQDDGDKVSISVTVQAHYKPAGAPDGEYQLLGTWSGGSNTITAAATETLRFTIEHDLDNSGPGGADYTEDRQYDVRIRRTTDDSTSSQRIDQVYWGSLRSVITQRPISGDAQSKLTVLALKIRATGQLNGVIDQFNLIAQTNIRDYSGTGSGAAAWPVSQTSNPASMFLYVLTSHVNPRPVADSRIDWPALETWHQWCEDHGYECNALVSREMPRDKLLISICNAGRAQPSRIDGKYTVILDAERPGAVQHFTPRNSWGYQGSKAFPEQPHALKVAFINAEMGFQPDERIVYDEGYNADGSGGLTPATRSQKVDGWGITNAEQAYKDGRYKLAVSRLRPETHTINVDIEHLVCTRGDRALFTHDVPLFGITQGRIKSMTADGSGNITHIESDELLPIEAGKTYGLRIRTQDDRFLAEQLVTVEGEQNVVELDTPIAPEDSPFTGDLFSFGEWGSETIDVIVAGIEPGQDLSARLTLIDYAPAIFNVDDPGFTIPPYDPQITKPGDSYLVPQITDIYDPDGAIKDLTDRQAESSATNLTKNDYEKGYVNTVTGATDIPAVPQLTASGIHAGVEIQLDWQRNLTNFDRYELLVTDECLELAGDLTASSTTVTASDTSSLSVGDTIHHPVVPLGASVDSITDGSTFELSDPALETAGGATLIVEQSATTWYKPINDDAEWKGAADDPAELTIPYQVYVKIPFIEQVDANGDPYPVGRRLFYKARRVTVLEVASGYSRVTAATTQTTEGSVGFQGLKASQIDVGVLNAWLAIITGNLQVVAEGIAGVTGDSWRSLQTAFKFALQYERTPGNFVDRAVIGGDPTQVFRDMFRGQGLVKTGADLSGLDLGHKAPAGSRRYAFNDSYADQDGADPWDFKSNLEFTSESLYGSYAIRNVDGQVATLRDDDPGLQIDTAFGIAAFYKPASPDPSSFLFDLRGSNVNAGRYWNDITNPATDLLHSVAQNIGRFVAVGESDLIIRSTDYGVSWSTITSPVSDNWRGIASDGNTWISVGFNWNVIRSTDDGQSFSVLTTISETLLCIRQFSGTWLIGGFNGNIYRSTDNGDNWTQITTPTANAIRDIGQTFDGLFAVGHGGTILKSTDDGLTWTSETSPTANDLHGIHEGDFGHMTAVGASGTIVKYDDTPKTWATVSSPTGADLNAVGELTGTADDLVAVGAGGAIIRSEDNGDTWSSVSSPTSDNLNSVLSYATMVAVGGEFATSSAVLRSRSHEVQIQVLTSSGDLRLRWVNPADVDESVFVPISTDWTFIAVLYDTTSIRLMVDTTLSDPIDVSGHVGSEWQQDLSLSMTLRDGRSIDDLLILPANELQQALATEHATAGYPWAAEDIVQTLLYKAKDGGTHRFADPLLAQYDDYTALDMLSGKSYVAPGRQFRALNNTTGRNTIVAVGGAELDIDTSAAWDTIVGTDYTVVANRAGVDFYIYRVPGGLIVSADSASPDGYSEYQKVGGFHCLCADILTDTYGYVNSPDDIELVDEAYVSHTISGTRHWLEGYEAGDVLPFSLFDISHRPKSRPQGMVYDPARGLWVDIYLASWSGSVLWSANGGTIADGSSSPAFHQYKFSQLFGRQKKRLPRQDDFVSLSLGSPQGVNISGSSDPGTTGGHAATDGNRIVSLIGCEDAAGVMWQWGIEAGATNDVGSSYANAYDGNDSNVAGQHYEAPNRPLFGGNWGDGARCGSRAANWNNPALNLFASVGARGVAEPYSGGA